MATLDPRVEPRVYEQDVFAVTLWTYYETVPPHHIAPDEYARALQRLHAGMQQVDLTGDWCRTSWIESTRRSARLTTPRTTLR